MIDTPVDFGTVCRHLESGSKYMNSEDIFKDVQCIWENCYKYYDKGNYILDLVERVKENFIKYWTAAGLFTGEPRGAHGKDLTVCFCCLVHYFFFKVMELLFLNQELVKNVAFNLMML